MRTAIGVVLSLLILCGAFSFFVEIGRSQPRIWTVNDDGPADFHTIQEAVDASRPRDVICVFSGTYSENVFIDKPLSLEGENRLTTKIVGEESDDPQPVVSIKADRVSIRGFSITNTESQGPGVVLRDSSDWNTIFGNVIADNYLGVLLRNSSDWNTIFGNVIADNYLGIVLRDSSDWNTIFGNVIADNYLGIVLRNSSNLNTITGNTIMDNEVGAEFKSSKPNMIFHNNFINNTLQASTLTPNKVNHWDDDYPSGGNYWSNHVTTDLYSGPHQNQPGYDGIGDTPYTIDANNIDRYPLMQPYDFARVTRYASVMFRHDLRHSGYSESPAPKTNRTQWSFVTGGSVGSSPAVAGGRVYVGSDDGFVYCLDAFTGAFVWSFMTGGSVGSSPAVVADRVYVGSCDGKVYCIDAVSGTAVWSFMTGGCVGSSPAVADGLVFVGSDDLCIYAVDQKTGTCIWSFVTGGSVESSPAVADGLVFAASSDHFVYALGSVIRVPEDYATIQEAIDAAEPEAAVVVSASNVFHGYLVFNKPIMLIGGEGSTPVFDGGGSGVAITLLAGASGSTVTGIEITNYDQGILIDDADDCDIYANIMSGNIVALNSADSATGNTIYANIISENEVGINISNSDGNTIYHNSFIDNNVQVVSETSMNAWDNGYPDGGNYWSTHITVDESSGPEQNEPGSDGIVDHEYSISTTNIDEYPLAKPYSPHDVGVKSVTTSKTVIGQGHVLHIETSILNYGTHDETFSVTAYVGTDVIGTQTVAISSRESMIITFDWNTSGFAKGNYTIKAVADTVPDETDTSDNELAGWVIVAMVGDITGPDGWPDGKCDIRDIALVARRFGVNYPDPKYNANCDLTGPTYGVADGKIDIRDIATVATHFGEVDP